MVSITCKKRLDQKGPVLPTPDGVQFSALAELETELGDTIRLGYVRSWLWENGTKDFLAFRYVVRLGEMTERDTAAFLTKNLIFPQCATLW